MHLYDYYCSTQDPFHYANMVFQLDIYTRTRPLQVRRPGGNLGECSGDTIGGLLGALPGTEDDGVSMGEFGSLPPVKDRVGVLGVDGDVGEGGPPNAG